MDLMNISYETDILMNTNKPLQSLQKGTLQKNARVDYQLVKIYVYYQGFQTY